MTQTLPKRISRALRVEALTLEAFAPFGTFTNLLEPSGPSLGAPPVEFFRDALALELGGHGPAFSTCRVEPREFVIDVLEYHSRTGEGILPLDADVLVQLAPASHPSDPPPVDALRVFRVPRGTMLAIRPGVWHHAPFSLGGAAHVLIALPERTYANDCVVVALEPEMQVQIEAR